MDDNNKGDLKLNKTEKRELAFREIVLIVLSLIGVGIVIWLGWFAK